MWGYLVEILHESVKDGKEVLGDDLLSEHSADFVDAGGQRAADLPLHVGGQEPVEVPQDRPVLPAQRRHYGRKAEGAVPGDFGVHRLNEVRILSSSIQINNSGRKDFVCFFFHFEKDEKNASKGCHFSCHFLVRNMSFLCHEITVICR